MTNRLKQLNKLIFNQSLAPADAVVWLQGDRWDRGPKTVELYKKGLAKNIVISGNNVLMGSTAVGRSMRPGEDNIFLKDMQRWLLKKGISKKDIVADKESYNTRDQAVNIISLAKRKKWKSIIVVGSWPYYQFRVFLTFLKAAEELRWNGVIINQFKVLKPGQKPGGRKQAAVRLQKAEVEKLAKYKKHLVTINQAINYLKSYEAHHING